MRFSLLTVTFLLMPLMLTACGPSSVSEREWMNIPPMDTTKIETASFETRTDTVLAKGERTHSNAASAIAADSHIQYTVQIGSFKGASLAAKIQLRARQRYHLPVVNDYDSQRRRYRVRIGFFDSNEEATGFCARLKKEFPAEYKDAWVAQLNK